MLDIVDKSLLYDVVGLPLIAYGVYLLKGINFELKSLANTVSEVKQWTQDHEKKDDERTADLKASVADCQNRWHRQQQDDLDEAKAASGSERRRLRRKEDAEQCCVPIKKDQT